MLDYSDDESQPQLREQWPVRAPCGGGRLFHRRGGEPPASSTTHSILEEWRGKSCELVTPKRDPPIMGAFIFSEILGGGPLKPAQELEKLGANLKGRAAALHGVDRKDLFSSGYVWVFLHILVIFTFIIRYYLSGAGSSKGPPLDVDDHPDSFYKSMRTLLFLAQFFAVFPLSGIRGSNYHALVFKWLHYKTAFWALSVLGTAFCFMCEIINGLKQGTFEAASDVLYFACEVLSSLLMLNLSRNWKRLSREFAQVEWKLQKYGYPRKVGLKFKILTIGALLVALVEHILGKLKNLELVLKCDQQRIEFLSFSESFFQREYHQVFSLYSYSFWKGALVLVAHVLTTANWNFKDLFLGTISWTIAERFKQVHDLLEKVQGQDKPISFWKEIREDYNTLSLLTKRVDSFIRQLMFLSVGNNLFFMCIQLFHSLKKKTNTSQWIYLIWSFGFLVLRTGFVAFSAARINDESKEPKAVLYSVPQKNYTSEVRRFLTQLTTNEVALTGSGFFSITRSLILTIIGSVITYEIVLVQFGSGEVEDDVVFVFREIKPPPKKDRPTQKKPASA